MPPRRVTRPPRPVYRPVSGRRQQGGEGVRIPNLWKYWRLWLVLGVVYLVWRQFDVRTIQINGLSHLDKATVTKEVSESLNSRPWGDNLLSMDPNRLTDDLQKKEYRIKTVHTVRHFPGTLEVQISERQPSLNWQTGGRSFVLDIDGSLIGETGAASANLPTVVDSTNLPAKVGDKVVPPHFVAFCNDVVAGMPKLGLRVVGLKVPDTTSEVYITTDKGYYVKFDTTREASGELSDLQSVLATLKKINKSPTQYIDLRVERKAYWL